jgi:hypothetical protein
VAVPSPLGTKVIPAGNAPVKLTAAVGTGGLVLTVNVPNVPTTNVTLFTLVIAGGGSTTNKVKDCMASGATPFVAVIVNA